MGFFAAVPQLATGKKWHLAILPEHYPVLYIHALNTFLHLECEALS